MTSIQKTFKRDGIEMLFNNIGVTTMDCTVTKGDLRILHKTMDINVWSMIYLTQLFLPLLKASANSQIVIVTL